MPGEFTVTTNGDPRVVAVHGEVDLATVPVLERRLFEQIESGSPALVVDLGDCSFIDSAGANLLVRAAGSLDRRGGGPVTLINMRSQARRLFDLIGLDAWVRTDFGVNGNGAPH